MSTPSSTTTLAASPTSFSSSSFASLSARTHASDADSLARMPLLTASAEEASFMPPISPVANSTPTSMSASGTPTLVAPVPRYPHLHLHLHLSRSVARGLSALPPDADVDKDVEEGFSDDRQAARYAARAAALFDRLADFTQTDDTLAAQDIRAFLGERRSFVGEDALIAVLPHVYIGHDGFYIGAGPNARQGVTAEHIRALCLLHLGLVEDVELACAHVQDKLDEIHAHLLREGGTDRLMPAAYLRGVRVARAPFWAHEAARLPMRLAGASLFGVAVGLALAPWTGPMLASAGAFAAMQLCFWPAHQGALVHDAAHKARQSEAWMALLRTERWSAGHSLASPQRSLRSTPEL